MSLHYKYSPSNPNKISNLYISDSKIYFKRKLKLLELILYKYYCCSNIKAGNIAMVQTLLHVRKLPCLYSEARLMKKKLFKLTLS